MTLLFPKSNPIRSARIREAARGQSCTVRIPGVCNNAGETTILAHFSYASSGMGTKPSDLASAAFCCFGCHEIVDRRAKRPHGVLQEDIEWCKARGMAETIARLVEMGIVTIAGRSA